MVQLMKPSVTALYQQVRDGNEIALNELVAGLYGELHRLAIRHLRRERSDHTLQPTALIHEVYLKLCDQSQYQFADRAHFLAIVSRVMRQVLVDYARARATRKRGGEHGDARLVPFDTNLEIAGERESEQIELLELDSALKALARENEGLAQLIEMRYFGGMTAEETAEALGRSVHVVRHDLRFAQAWLRRERSRHNIICPG
jgi:RNA polymerase sigma factor (TIGR02999 family)